METETDRQTGRLSAQRWKSPPVPEGKRLVRPYRNRDGLA